MNQHQAVAVRALTEAMVNAYNMNDDRLLNALRDEVLGQLRPQAPDQPFVVEGGKVFINEAAVAASAPQEEAKSIEQLVTEVIGDQCPCCVISGLLISGEPFPYGMEEFFYGFSKACSSPEEVRATLEAVAKKIEGAIDSGELKPSVEFAHRYAEFTFATGKVRDRLADEGVLPQLNMVQRLQKDLLEASIQQRLAAL